MLAILNSLKKHNFPIFQQILMIFVSKLMVYRALSDKTYLLLGLLSPLTPRWGITFIIPRRSRRDIVLAALFRLSVRNHISVPICQI